MQLNYNLTNYYDVSYNIELQGQLNHAHWYVWEVTYNEIVICHDTQEDIINACKVLGDSIDVWIDGDRTECLLEVTADKHYGEDEAVYITLPVTADDDALYGGPYDCDQNAEIN